MNVPRVDGFFSIRCLVVAWMVVTLGILSLADTSPEVSKGISFPAEESGGHLGARMGTGGRRESGSSADTARISEFLSFVREQSPDAKENGVWIVVTDPDAYGQAENKLLEDVKAVYRRQRISLFIARASELPNGWKRYD